MRTLVELCLRKILSRRSFGVEFHNIASFGWRLSFFRVKEHGTFSSDEKTLL